MGNTKRVRVGISVLLVILLVACKKDRLTGTALDMAGTWYWKSTQSGSGVETPMDEGIARTLIIMAKGKYEYQENGTKLEKGRLTYVKLTSTTDGNYEVVFRKNNFLKKEEAIFPGKSIVIVEGGDSLYVYQNIESSNQPVHLFVRQ